MNDTATSIESRFEGHDVLEAGVAQIPNMLINHYHHLGLSDGQFTLLCHILSRKWTKDAPYPSITGIRMSANVDTRRRYVRDLRQKGLLFTSRLYWTKEDMETNPNAYPGRVRSNLWYLGSLLHNLARMDHWLKEGNSPETFQVEIPLTTVRMFLKGDFHDTPKEIIQAIQEQTKNGTVLKAVILVCENHTLEPSMRKASSRKTSTRKTHSLKEESDSKKNQKVNKNQAAAAVAAEKSVSKKGKGGKPVSPPVNDVVFIQACQKYQEVVGEPPSANTANKIKGWLKRCPANWLILALDKMGDANSSNWGYVESIMKEWEKCDGPENDHGPGKVTQNGQHYSSKRTPETNQAAGSGGESPPEAEGMSPEWRAKLQRLTFTYSPDSPGSG